MFVDACYLSNASNGTAIAIPLGEVAPDDLCGRDKILRLGS
jgi:hypothetical protein